jgi:hypothetical protein
MSERTARAWKVGPLPSETKTPRTWRTRTDPFADVWDTDVLPLLRDDERGILQPTFVLELLRERHPGRFDDSHLRTLQRRISDWRALEIRDLRGEPRTDLSRNAKRRSPSTRNRPEAPVPTGRKGWQKCRRNAVLYFPRQPKGSMFAWQIKPRSRWPRKLTA